MRKKIAIIHPKLDWGGSEATVLWMIEALKNDYDVSLVTSGKVGIPGLNKYYGTNLSEKEFRIINVPMPAVFRNTAKFAAIRGRFIQRHCQRISLQFDLMTNAYNPCDFKTRGIQFATDIEALPNIIVLSGLKKLWYGNTILRKAYMAICDFISPLNPEAWKNNVTISNSYWTSRLILSKYNLRSQVLYPPVNRTSLSAPSEKKDKGFVCVGRIVPEKRIDAAIEIIKKVRQKGHDLHLHIIGGVGDEKYAHTIKNLCSENKDWLFFEGRLSEEDKRNIIAKHQFGISCKKNEPFGIAVAEMVKAGCIVFVPDSGGQTEIVESSDLIFKDADEAVQRIEAVVKSEKLQNELREHLSIVSQKFSVENFKKSIRDIVTEYFNDKKDQGIV